MKVSQVKKYQSDFSKIKLKVEIKYLHGIFLLFIAVCFSFNPDIEAQTQTVSDSGKTFLQKNIQLSGDIGAYGELYSISGQDRRRPPSTGRIFFTPTLYLFNAVSLSFNFLISTEGSYARQNINQFGLNPSWGWGKAHLGDFTENFSDFTLNGILIRGAGISIHPGWFNFSIVGGFTRRSVPGGAANGSFDRYLFGTKIGVGHETGSYFNLMFLRVRDDPSSLPSPTPTVTVLSPNGGDVWPVGSIQTIQWTSTNLTSSVKIELSRDGGNTYHLLFANQPNAGSVSWTVTGIETFQALIKITSMTDSTVTDVSDAPFTIGSNVTAQQGTTVPTVVNPFAVTPQENMVAATNWQIKFLNDKLAWHSEVSGSVYSKDMRASALNIDSINVPGFITGIYTPRIGTNIDYALQSDLNYRSQLFNAKFAYKLIGPGYNSLGLSYLINDQQEFSAMTSFNLSGYYLNFNWARFNDNLINQKLFTTVRNQFNVSVNGMITSFWSGSIMTSILGMNNNSSNDTTQINFSTFVIGTNHAFMFQPNSVLRSINLNYTYQTSGDNSPLRTNTRSITNSANLGFSFGLLQNLSLTASGGLVSSVFADTMTTTTTIYSLGLQHLAFNNRLITALTFSASLNGGSNSMNTRLFSSYQLTDQDMITISLSSNNFRGSSLTGGSFDEYIASLMVSHRF